MDIRVPMSNKAPYWLFVALVLVLAGLQYRLWVGEGSLAQVAELQRQIDELRLQLAQQTKSNDMQ